ncbi:L-rhamnose mutarotase [Spirosoma fluminis]
MQLFEGQAAEYQRRHDELWPELQDLLKRTGISAYSIFLDESTHTLFGVMEAVDLAALDRLPQEPVMQRWWAYMQDIMATNPDNSPVSKPLREVFYLP